MVILYYTKIPRAVLLYKVATYFDFKLGMFKNTQSNYSNKFTFKEIIWYSYLNLRHQPKTVLFSE